jgi:DNA-binding response OmpR family regulator
VSLICWNCLFGIQVQILTPAIIFERVWDADQHTGPEVLKVYIHALRKKLNGNGRADLTHAVRGVGYMFKP